MGEDKHTCVNRPSPPTSTMYRQKDKKLSATSRLYTPCTVPADQSIYKTVNVDCVHIRSLRENENEK